MCHGRVTVRSGIIYGLFIGERIPLKSKFLTLRECKQSGCKYSRTCIQEGFCL